MFCGYFIAMSMDFTLEIAEHPPKLMIALKGDITSEARAQIRQAYARAHNGAFETVIFDFDEVRYINSEGVAVFFSLVRDMTGNLPKIVFSSLSPNLQGIVRVVGLTDYVRLADKDEVWPAEAE